MLSKEERHTQIPHGTSRSWHIRDTLCTPFCARCYRFTKPGDTVVSLCGDSNRLPEVAISRARRIETFVTDADSLAVVQKRVDDALFSA